MTLYAILAAVAAIVGAFLGLRRKASRERDARVMAEVERDVARGKAEVAEATVAVVAEVEARKDAGHANEGKVEAVAAAATAHPERAAARERARLHDENAANVRSKIDAARRK